MKFKSGLEQKFNRQFPSLKYETTRFPYVVTHHYTPDFQVNDYTFIECKGLFTSADRAKHLHIKKQHPFLKIIFVFENPFRRLTKNSKTTYAEWCNKHGFEFYHINNVHSIYLGV